MPQDAGFRLRVIVLPFRNSWAMMCRSFHIEPLLILCPGPKSTIILAVFSWNSLPPLSSQLGIFRPGAIQTIYWEACMQQTAGIRHVCVLLAAVLTLTFA